MTRLIFINLAIALGYFILGRLGLLMALPPGYVTALWPPAGLALAACLVWGGQRVWPGIFVGSFLVNATAQGGFDVGWLQLAIALGNTTQARVGELLLRRLEPALSFDYPVSVLRFSLAVLASCLVAATVGNGALYLLGMLPAAQLPQSYLTWWMGDALGALIFAPMALSLFHPDPLWRQRRLRLGLPLLLAFLLCGIIYIYVSKSEERHISDLFRHEAHDILERQSRQISAQLQAVNDLSAFFEASEEVTPEEFAHIAGRIHLASPGLYALKWEPVVERKDMAAHESDISRYLNRPYQVWRLPEWQANPDQLIIPITYINPLAGNEQLLGLDLNSSPPHAQAFRQAMESGKVVVSRLLTCPHDPHGPGAVALVAPVRDKNGKVIGFCDACKPLSLVLATLAEDKALDWSIHDLDDGGKRIHSNRTQAFPVFSGDIYFDRSGVYFQETLSLAGRRWQVMLHKPVSAIGVNEIPLSTLVLGLALGVSVLLGNFLMILTGYTRRTEQIIAERTRELRQEITLRQEMENNLANAQHISHTGSWTLDHRTGTLHWSEEIFRIFEIDPALFAASYQAFLDAIHPADRDQVNQAFSTHLTEQLPYDLEHRLLMADGRIKYVHERCATERDASGAPLRSLGTMQDITRRKQAELALAQSEAAWRETMDHFQDAIYVLDTRRHLLRANQAFYTFTGSDPATAIGQHIVTIIHPEGEETPCAVCQAQEALRDAVITMEADHPHNPAGRPVEIMVKIIRDDQGEPDGILMSLHDLSHERQMQKAVADSEAKFRSLVENIPGAAYRCQLDDEEWTVDYVSNGIEAITGYPASDFIGNRARSFTSLIHPDDSARVNQSVRESVSQERPFVVEYRITHADGNIRWVWERGSALRATGEKTRHLHGVFFDITERKQIEAELEQHRNNLEDLVTQRTAQLEQARSAAEAANRAKSVFLANMSHELRTPLNAILGFSQLMERDARIPAEQRQNLQTINKSGQHLLSLINDILEISRIETGRQTLHAQDFDVQELLQTLTESMRLRARDKGLELRLELAPALPRHIRADLGKLRQVLLNLISNALKYTDQGEVVIQASMTDGEHMLFEVRDSGMGIAPDELEKIFQPFYQTEQGIRLGEGTGLGLAICNEYAKIMDGQLSASSVRGTGSTFRFRLPVQLAEAPAISPVQPVRVLGLTPGQPEWRILVAEDNPDSQQFIAELLTQAGFQVRCANDGQAAVALFQEWQPHLVCMDMRMPVLDGYAATRAIRALPGGAQPPIIALTASAFEEERANIIAAGCNDMLGKPLEINRLFECIARHLGVAFDYADAAREEMPETPPAGELSALPAELRQRLEQAAIALDSEAVRAIAGEIAENQPHLAQYIESLVAIYRFDELQQRLQTVRNSVARPTTE